MNKFQILLVFLAGLLGPFQRSTVARYVLVLVAVAAWLLLAAVCGPVYTLTLAAGRLVILTLAARVVTVAFMGAACGLLAFLSAVGGVLYLAGLVGEALHLLNPINGQDLGLLVKVVGLAFLLLPFVVGSLPPGVRHSLGLGRA